MVENKTNNSISNYSRTELSMSAELETRSQPQPLIRVTAFGRLQEIGIRTSLIPEPTAIESAMFKKYMEGHYAFPADPAIFSQEICNNSRLGPHCNLSCTGRLLRAHRHNLLGKYKIDKTQTQIQGSVVMPFTHQLKHVSDVTNY